MNSGLQTKFVTSGQVAQIDAMKKEQAKTKELENLSITAQSNLSGYIKKIWERNRNSRDAVNSRLLDCLRARKGEYSTSQLAAISRTGGADPIYLKLTGTKCRAAAAWLRDILIPVRDKSWEIIPTPIPSLPEELTEAVTKSSFEKIGQMLNGGMQLSIEEQVKFSQLVKEKVLGELQDLAQAGVDSVELKIEDAMAEGNWTRALEEVLEDFVTYPFAVLKGPYYQTKRVLSWKAGVPTPTTETLLCWRRVSPFDFYYSPTAKSAQEGDLIERLRYSQSTLHDLIGVEGYSEENIRAVLNSFNEGGLHNWMWSDFERDYLENNSFYFKSDKETIDGLHFWGHVKGQDLIDWGYKGKVEDPLKMYPVDAILIGGHVIRAEINKDPMHSRPYHTACWDSIPGSLVGIALSEQMDDHQKMVNATARSLATNLSISSGPQVSVLTDMLAEGESITSVFPMKIWQMKSSLTGNSGKPVEFFQPIINSAELLSVLNAFEQKADDVTNVPRYSYGNEKIGGAGSALADYERVLTPTGPVEIGSLKVGDKIANTYNGISEVTGVYPQGVSSIFKMNFSDGSSVGCDMNHRWSVRTHHDRKFQVLTTEQIVKKGLFRKTKVDERNPRGFRPRWMLPIIDGVSFASKKVKVDAYTMGVLIGDGDNRARVTSMDQEIFDNIPYKKGIIDDGNDSKAWSQTVLGIKGDYLSYGLNITCLDKFIPDDYLYNSRKVRMELLKGLMDTDGCCDSSGNTFFSTSSERLRDNFIFLVKSLGADVADTVTYPEGDFEMRGKIYHRMKNYRINFILNESVFKLSRKIVRESFKKKKHTYIVGISYLKEHPATCISVNSKDNLFVCENLIPTHNTATGLSMLMNSAAKGIRRAIANIDLNMIQTSVYQAFVKIMLKDPDPSIRGDVKITARGSAATLIKEQLQANQKEFLQITSNPLDIEILGKKGRAELLKQIADGMGLDISGLPTKEELEMAELQEKEMEKQAHEAEVAQAQAQAQAATQPEGGQQIDPAQLQALEQQAQQVEQQGQMVQQQAKAVGQQMKTLETEAKKLKQLQGQIEEQMAQLAVEKINNETAKVKSVAELERAQIGLDMAMEELKAMANKVKLITATKEDEVTQDGKDEEKSRVEAAKPEVDAAIQKAFIQVAEAMKLITGPKQISIERDEEGKISGATSKPASAGLK